MQWNKPEAPNGNISGYRLFYAAEQFTNVKTINSSADIVTGEIEGLGNFLSFKIYKKNHVKMLYKENNSLYFKSLYLCNPMSRRP